MQINGVSAVPTVNPGNYDAGAINTHSMDMLKQEQMLKKEREDYKKYQQLKKDDSKKNDEIRDEQESETKTPIKAKVSEYETEGVYVNKINFTESSIFTEEELNEFAKQIEGQNVFMPRLEQLVTSINKAYAEKGYVTARAFLVPQLVDNGNINIDLVEGKVGNITVSGNRWTKSKYITQRLTQKKGAIFDILQLEKDILNFNRYNEGIKIKGSLYPGTENHSTDIKFEAEETFPFHLTTYFDNAGRKTIGKLRGGLALQSDSLFGYRDRFALGAYASKSSITPFADYSIPVNKYDGRVGLTYSSSFADITSGDFSMFNIKSRSQNYSLYYSHPLIRKPAFELTGIVSANYKQATTSFDGTDLYTDKISAAQATLAGKYNSKRGIWYATQSFYHALPLIQKESKYFKYEGSLVRLHDFSHGIIGQFRTNYQVVPTDVIPYVDQMQAGGISSVRGYSEGLLIGKSGYVISAELIFPIAPSEITLDKKNDKPRIIPFIGKWIKGAVFVDHAGIFPFKGNGPGAQSVNSNDYLLGGGLGLRISLPGDLTGRLYWGFPMINNNHEQVSRGSRFHFEITLTPDFYKIMEMRKSKKKDTL